MVQMHPEQIAKALLHESFSSRRTVVILFVLINAAVLAVGWFWPKGFTASTSILVEEKNIIQPLMQGAAVATEVADRSKNVREVIFGRKIMDAILEAGEWMKDRPSPEEQERIVEGIKKRTLVTTAGKNLLIIEYRDIDPERALHVTQKYAELFIRESLTAKAAESRAAFDFIEKQAQDYHTKLARTEDELKELRSASLDARAGSDAELTARLNDLYTRIVHTTQELKEAEIKGASLEKQVSTESESIATFTREGQYQARIAELQSKLDALRLTYHDTHPDIIQIMQQMKDMTDAMNAQREKREQSKRSGKVEPSESMANNPIYQGMRRELSQNEVAVEGLKARIAELQQQLQVEITRGKRMHNGDARFAELTRDYQVNKDIYQDLLRRRENARVSMNLDLDRQGLTFKIQEPAVLPVSPTGLRFAHFVLGGVLLGILVPLGLLFARLQIDPRIRVPSEISRVQKVPVLAVVPHLWSPAELKSLRWETGFLTLLVVGTLAAAAALSVLRLTKLI